MSFSTGQWITFFGIFAISSQKGIIGTENFKKQERVYLLYVKEAVTLNFQWADIKVTTHVFCVPLRRRFTVSALFDMCFKCDEMCLSSFFFCRQNSGLFSELYLWIRIYYGSIRFKRRLPFSFSFCLFINCIFYICVIIFFSLLASFLLLLAVNPSTAPGSASHVFLVIWLNPRAGKIKRILVVLTTGAEKVSVTLGQSWRRASDGV